MIQVLFLHLPLEKKLHEQFFPFVILTDQIPKWVRGPLIIFRIRIRACGIFWKGIHSYQMLQLRGSLIGE